MNDDFSEILGKFTDILKEAGQIDTDVPYEKLVITP